MAISAGIFRQYDIRGIVGKDLTTEAALAIGGAYAAYLAEHGTRGAVVVSRDNRPSGAALRDALVSGLTIGGLDVIDIGVVPTPLNYWALHHLPVVGGIQITGSHNPPEYNGFKLSMGTGSLHGEHIQDLYKLTQTSKSAGGPTGTKRDEAVIDRYIDDIVTRIGPLARHIRVVYDCGNGAGALVATGVGYEGARKIDHHSRAAATGKTVYANASQRAAAVAPVTFVPRAAGTDDEKPFRGASGRARAHSHGKPAVARGRALGHAKEVSVLPPSRVRGHDLKPAKPGRPANSFE